MKIYTKRGDQGETSLLAGQKVKKHDIRIETYGTTDELNAWIGLIRDQAEEADTRERLVAIQDRLFTIGAILASGDKDMADKLPDIKESDVDELEHAMDEMDKELPPMRSFVLPGGHTTVSYCHIARCICRRAERKATHLAELEEVSGLILKYLNRLSDYLFVLARKLTQTLEAEETPWEPKKTGTD